ncbi:uncharacterized protein F5Z01DRAFT_631735 [Emericellopsis atlantica]|uniref:Rhodopsin domain-containing protein n=1 Tax=Emericellopsis atlantica TaxID=2614577 RepID=A0A9P8CK04_9HYPO|nr:uncharacterized protein F5Z01DRAFT_631735 [Emericellopsis atlantica]KAG9249435.1 hypothetical protein F5Z01DRAFT_631735 [Emericellopsis atlantica]
MSDGEAPAPGLPPAISNPEEDESGRIMGAVVAVTTLALITVLTRFYVRTVMIRSLGWDDAMMALTMMTSLAGCGLAVASVQYGAGRHRGDVPADDFQTGMKLNFISQPTYLFAICFVKLAVGCSLLRIASTKFYTWLISGIMGFMLFYTIACFFTIILQCTDIRVLWNPNIQSTCWTMHTLQSLSYTNNALNIITDLLFAVVIPAPMLWNLNVHRRTRVTLLFVLGLGVFACAAALVKVGYVVNYGKVGDFLWDSQDITIWTAAETNVGIVAGSLPTLRPIFKSFLGSVYGRGTKPSNDPSHIYGHGTSRSSKHWQALSSGGRNRSRPADDLADETSSQEAIALGRMRDEYDLAGKSGAATTIVSSARAAGEDPDQSGMASGLSRQGIQKTTSTTVYRSEL